MRSIEEENRKEYQEYKQYEYEDVTQYWISLIIVVSCLNILFAGALLSFLFEPTRWDQNLECVQEKELFYYVAILALFIGLFEIALFCFGLSMKYNEQITLFGKIQRYQRIEQAILLFILVFMEAYIYKTRRTCKINQTYYSLYVFYFWQLFWCAFIYNFDNLT